MKASAGFSRKWDLQYKNNSHKSVWPWSELISYVTRYAVSSTPRPLHVLELGCGAGANIPFFLEKKWNYFGIDGSENIIKKLKKRFPEIKENLKVGDFTKNIPFEYNFDIIVDRASLTHNSSENILNCLELVIEKMNPGAKYFGIDWFSTNHDEYSLGKPHEDVFTRIGYTQGPFANVGQVHFSNKRHLLNLFSKFKIIVLEHKIVNSIIPAKKRYAYWNFVAQKP
mgnify:FL=1